MINIDEIEEICDAMIEEGMDYCPPAGCGTAANVKELITKLRQYEKDAARYRWALDNCLLGIGRNGATWDLQFEGPSPDHIGQVSDAIDEAMQCT